MENAILVSVAGELGMNDQQKQIQLHLNQRVPASPLGSPLCLILEGMMGSTEAKALWAHSKKF